MEQLAMFGGVPVRETPIYYTRHCIEQDDIDAVVTALRSDAITCGPRIGELEQKLCEVTGARYAVVVSSGTAALHIAAMAAGLKEGDEAIVSAVTFAASSNCVLYCGAKPVFADINAQTYNIDPDAVRKLITPATKAVIAVDFTGQAVQLDEIRAICAEHKLVLIEDAAHAIGTKYKGRPVGSIADMTCFSFHPAKTVTAGEGGAVTTNDEALYHKLLLLRAHGITRNRDEMVYPAAAGWYYEQVDLGYNYRMTDFQAALLNSQLNKLQRFSKRRREIVEQYNEAFADMPELIVQEEIPESDSTRHLYILRLNPERLSCDRRQFFDAMRAENIYAQVNYIPVYYHPYYESLGYVRGICPNAEKYYDEVMSIPLYPAMSDEDVENVIHAVKKITAYYKK